AIADLGRSQSLFARLMKSEDAMNLLLHVSLPEDIRKALEPLIDAQIRKDVEKEKDAAQKAMIQQFLGAIKPSVQSGELDGLLHIAGPVDGSKYDMIGGLKIKDGATVLEAIRSFVKSRPAREQALVQMDADKAGDTSIHRVNVQSQLDEQAKRIF